MALCTKHTCVFRSYCVYLIFIQVLQASTLYSTAIINNTCVEEKMTEIESEARSKFHFLAEMSKINDGKVLDYNLDTGIAKILLHREVGNISTHEVDHYIQTVSVLIHPSGEVLNTTIDQEENVNNLLFQDADSSGNSARLFIKKERFFQDEYYIEQYLTVVTKDEKTSCTLRLSQFNSHGRVLTDDTFGVFKFSPDGRQV